MSTVVVNLPKTSGGGGGGGGDASAANQLTEIGQLQSLNIKLDDKSFRYDKASDTVSYFAEATIGSLDSSAVWKIRKVDTTTGVKITYASSTYNQIWDNRASLTYV